MNLSMLYVKIYGGVMKKILFVCCICMIGLSSCLYVKSGKSYRDDPSVPAKLTIAGEKVVCIPYQRKPPVEVEFVDSVGGTGGSEEDAIVRIKNRAADMGGNLIILEEEGIRKVRTESGAIWYVATGKVYAPKKKE
jgi:hypothetical protein